MSERDDTRTLQMFYAALLVDAASNFEQFGVAAQVAEKKAREQALAAPSQIAQLGIGSPRRLFERFSAIFGCARWTVSEEPGGATVAETAGCLACAIAKKRGGGKPCEPYCINPFRALAGALSPAKSLVVGETLWEGERCRFRLERSPA